MSAIELKTKPSSAALSPGASAAHSIRASSLISRKVAIDEVSSFTQVLAGLHIEPEEDKRILLQAFEDLIAEPQATKRATHQDSTLKVESAGTPEVRKGKSRTKTVKSLTLLCLGLFVAFLILSGWNIYFSTAEPQGDDASFFNDFGSSVICPASEYDERNREYLEIEQSDQVEVNSKAATIIEQAPSDSCYDVKSKSKSLVTKLANGRTVVCDTVTDGGGWVVMQRRVTGDVNFYLGWCQYREGFGNPTGDFWLGLEYVHQLTNES